MWVLSTDRAELHYFPSPEGVPGGFAILSHVWGRHEQTFQDLQRLKQRCASPWIWRTVPRDLACAKIRRCCEFAQKHGYRWVWIDTCCIDKSSSAELQEAINSMFRYYSLAEVCYAYLEDVPSESAFVQGPGDHGTAFSRSVWHRRGWTLQELIAPRLVLFLSRSWKPLGSKSDLADRIEEETGIPDSVLRGTGRLDEFSIAQRMSWAAKRQTTRMEDEAYSLMGLFDVNMPTIYGEGRKAFQRLQEEIMRRNPDTTLFAWGDICDLSDVKTAGPPENHSSIFAQSPADFRGCSFITEPHHRPGRGDQRESDEAGTDTTTTLSITPRGVLANVKIMQWRCHRFAAFPWRDRDGHALVLYLDMPSPITRGLENTPPTFCVAQCFFTRQLPFVSTLFKCRLVRTQPPILDEVAVSVARQDVYFAYGASHLPDHDASLYPLYSMPRIPMDTSLDAPFRFHKYVLVELWRKYHTTKLQEQTIGLPGPPQWDDSSYAATFSLVCSEISGWANVNLGLCASSPGTTRVHWANVHCCTMCPASRSEGLDNGSNLSSHECPADHIGGWANLEKTFRIAGGHMFTLRFIRCGLNPERTMVLWTIEADLQSESSHHKVVPRFGRGRRIRF